MNTKREIHNGIGGEMDSRATDQGRRCFEENGGELGSLGRFRWWREIFVPDRLPDR
jgi:hypothetical protein